MGQGARHRSRPLSDLKEHVEEILRGMRKDRRPVVLTSRGRAQAVLQDIAAYEAERERLRLLESILRGLRAEARGDLVSHEDAMRELDALLDA